MKERNGGKRLTMADYGPLTEIIVGSCESCFSYEFPYMYMLTLLQDNSKMDLLVEQLDSYRKNGIPKPNILSCEEDDLQRKL